MENFFSEHIRDLSDECIRKNCFVFSDFLSEDEISEVIKNKKSLAPFSMWGGCEGAERMMLRFGDPGELFYEEDFPLTCITAEPLNMKFADTLTHRDFLGAVMNLSIERNQIGDIIVSGNKAYIFAKTKIAPFICGNLNKVKHTNIKAYISENGIPETTSSFRQEDYISSSLRADCIISAVYNLSRNSVSELFRTGKVFINSSSCENPSKLIKTDDKISLRGYGKFIFCGETGKTKKDRLKIRVKIYV